MKFGRQGNVFVSVNGGKAVPVREITLSVDRERVASTMVSMSYPRCVNGELTLDSFEELVEAVSHEKEKPKRGGRQESFGKFLNKGKRW